MNKNTANGFEVRPYRAGDAEKLLKRGLRKSDEAELLKLTGLEAEKALLTYLPLMEAAGDNSVIEIDGQVSTLFGVCALAGELNAGAPWLLAHPDFEREAVAMNIARLGRVCIAMWLAKFERLENVCDPDNAKGLKFLEWLGFKFDFERPVYGPLGHKLLKFWRVQ